MIAATREQLQRQVSDTDPLLVPDTVVSSSRLCRNVGAGKRSFVHAAHSWCSADAGWPSA